MAEELNYNLLPTETDSIGNSVLFEDITAQVPDDQKYDFDLRGALQAGYSEEDIARFLAGELGYDYNELRTKLVVDPTTGKPLEQTSYTDRDIINLFVPFRDVSKTEFMQEELKKGLAKGVPGAFGAKAGLRAGVAYGSRIHPIYGTLGS